MEILEYPPNLYQLNPEGNWIIIMIGHIKKQFEAIFKITPIQSTWDNSNNHVQVEQYI